MTVERGIQDVVLFAAVGSNPALLASAVWALGRKQEMRVVEAHLVLAKKGYDYLESELLVEGRGLTQLHEVMGAGFLPRAALHTHLLELPDGTPVDDDLTGPHAAAYQDGILRTARLAVASAGKRPLIFGLIAGRRRTMTLMVPLVAQFLARPSDRLFDLRIEPRGADQPNVFFFPEQTDRQVIHIAGAELLPRDVSVTLVEVQVPRLGGLLPKGLPGTYGELISMGQKAIDNAAPLQLTLELGHKLRGAFVHDPATGEQVDLELKGAYLLYFASLCWAHQESPEAEWVPIVRAQDQDHAFGRLVRRLDWAQQITNQATEWFCNAPDPATDEDHAAIDSLLRTLRSRARAKLARVKAERWQDPRYGQLVPLSNSKGAKGQERLPLRSFEIHWPQDP